MIREKGSQVHATSDPHCKLHWTIELADAGEPDPKAQCVICSPCATPEREQATAPTVRELGS